MNTTKSEAEAPATDLVLAEVRDQVLWLTINREQARNALNDAVLVNYVVPAAELDAKVNWLLNRIVSRSPTAIRRGKYALRATLDMTLEQSLAYMETQLGTLSLTKDAAEGIASFNEKRAPNWTG